MSDETKTPDFGGQLPDELWLIYDKADQDGRRFTNVHPHNRDFATRYVRFRPRPDAVREAVEALRHHIHTVHDQDTHHALRTILDHLKEQRDE